MVIHISHLLVVATIAVQYGSVPLTNGSGSESCKFIAHLVRSQVTELREGSLFMLEDEAG
jgi:hypothetical protein